MKEGDIIIAPLVQADGQTKNRPALVLRVMPGFGDVLICGFSTKLGQQIVGFDETISPADSDFAASGLVTALLIRLGFLTLSCHAAKWRVLLAQSLLSAMRGSCAA